MIRSPHLRGALAIALGAWILGALIYWGASALGGAAKDAGPDLHLAARLAEAVEGRSAGRDVALDPSLAAELHDQLRTFYPGAALYRLDLRGGIVSHDPRLGPPAVSEVPMALIRKRLDRAAVASSGVRLAAEPYALGLDPHRPSQPAPFSVAVLQQDDRAMAYLYLVFPAALGQRGDGLWSAGWWLLLSFGAAAIFAFGLSRRLGRPLRALADAMDELAPEQDLLPVAPGESPSPSSPLSHSPSSAESLDEVGRLEARFEAMALRVRERLDDAERLDQMRRELFTNVSHDLRTPIATLRGYLETVAFSDKTLSTEQRSQYLAIALKHAERLGRLVNEILELSKLDGERFAPNLERFPMAELIQDNVQRFQLRARSKGVELHAELDGELPPVSADVGLMERALENLIENAVRHTESGGTVTVSLSGSGNGAGGGLLVQVVDTGCGIPREELPLIFDRFYTPKSSRRGEGSGLGLAITRRIVELHHAELQVESRVGEGSVFSFCLPAAPPTQGAKTRTSGRLARITRQTRQWMATRTQTVRSPQTVGTQAPVRAAPGQAPSGGRA